MPTVTTLMSTYAAETAENLAESLESIWSQTRPPEQVVLVVDGPIDATQEAVIRRYFDDPRVAELRTLWLERNGGLAEAMNAGLAVCRGDFVMRMDSDDIATPDRLAIQLAYATAHPDIDFVSSWSEEFFPGSDRRQLKTSPVGHDHVIRALRWRNIIVHPTILVSTSMLRAVGGYRAKYGYLEDYDLFVRLAMLGCRFHVIPKALVQVRSGLDQRSRRGGLRYTLREVLFRMECWRRGFLGTGQLLSTTLFYVVFRLISGGARTRLYALARS